jgi:penicillin-binding protein 2
MSKTFICLNQEPLGEQNKIMESSKKILASIIAIGFVILFLRLIQLQIFQGGYYFRMANENAAKVIPIRAPRGIIYDRHGKVMVSNRAVFSVFAVPSVLRNADVPSVIANLSKIINMSPQEIQSQIDNRKSRPFEPVLIKDNLSLVTVTQLEEEKNTLAGIVVRSRPMREYPYGSLAVHVLGYVGEIEALELDRMKGFGYRLGDVIGKAGVEQIYDRHIRGVDGGQKIEVDVYGAPVGIVGSTDPIPGKDVFLTIDLELQNVVEQAMEGWAGAVVVLDVASGEILALASKPDFDPNIFSQPLTRKQWQQIDRKNHPFMNRAVSVYPPGSTYKPVTLTAVLEEKIIPTTEAVDCRGSYRLGRRVAKCWLEHGHGKIDIIEALVWSCNVSFYEMGLKSGIKNLHDYSKKYGLGLRTGVDLPNEKSGLVPDLGWKKRNLGEPWYDGDAINMAIGQSFLEVSPLQMVNFFAQIATGKRWTPHVMSRIIDRDGRVAFAFQPKLIEKLPVSEKTTDYIRGALREVVRRGTGVAARVAGFPAAGKTGTAENPGKAHAWFICYAPYDEPEIAIAAFIAHGEHGDRAPARISKKVLEWYKENRYQSQEKQYEEEFPPQYIMHGRYRSPYYRR